MNENNQIANKSGSQVRKILKIFLRLLVTASIVFFVFIFAPIINWILVELFFGFVAMTLLAIGFGIAMWIKHRQAFSWQIVLQTGRVVLILSFVLISLLDATMAFDPQPQTHTYEYVGAFFGLLAFALALNHLKQVKLGSQDVPWKRLVKVAMITGLVCTLANGFVIARRSFPNPFVIIDYSSNKDAILIDLTNLMAHAYEYRMHRGGEGSYIGYKIPPKLADNENAVYTVLMVDRDSLEIAGLSKTEPGSMIYVKINSQGKSYSWRYTGEFE